MLDDLYNKFARLRSNILYKTIMQIWQKYHCRDISNIPAEDREIIDLLFSDKDRKEIAEILKNRKTA